MIPDALRVVQITESLNVEYGGLAAACAQLAGHLADAGAAVSVATVEEAQGGRRVPLDARVSAISCAPSGPRRLRFSRALRPALDGIAPSIVHVHGLWRLYLRQTARFAQLRRLPLIVSTHGMLHGPARRRRGRLKALVRWLGQDAILEGAACLHATATEEADEIRGLGFRAPIAVIPWGVDQPLAGPRPGPRAAAPEGRVVLFLGRFHPTKGLDTLLRAWTVAVRRFPSARLVLAGYDDGGFRSRFEALAESLGVSSSVGFRGAVEGREREELFARSSLLVLPSPSENFGLVVPEALIRGLPVITSRGTPWSAVARERCGWWVPASQDGIAGALAEALAAPSADLDAMGERGRAFAGAAFAWDRVAASMMDVYAWTLGRSPIPSCVHR